MATSANTPQEKTFELTTTAQTEKLFRVKAADETQARARLRTHFKDAALLREGIVAEQAESKDTTPRKITAAKALPAAVPTTGSAAAGHGG